MVVAVCVVDFGALFGAALATVGVNELALSVFPAVDATSDGWPVRGEFVAPVGAGPWFLGHGLGSFPGCFPGLIPGDVPVAGGGLICGGVGSLDRTCFRVGCC